MKVLVIDDDEFICNLYELICKKFNVDCVICKNLFEATNKLVSENFDICFIDKNLPETNEVKLLEFLEQKNLTSKSIIMSGDLMSSEETLRSYKVRDILQKPFSIEKVLKYFNLPK